MEPATQRLIRQAAGKRTLAKASPSRPNLRQVPETRINKGRALHPSAGIVLELQAGPQATLS